MMRPMLIMLVILSMFWTLSADFIGGSTAIYNVSSTNASYLSVMQNISTTTASVRNQLNATQTSGETVQGFDLGGLWASMQIYFRMPELFGAMLSGIATTIPFDTSVVIGGIMIIVTTLFALKIGGFIRTGETL